VGNSTHKNDILNTPGKKEGERFRKTTKCRRCRIGREREREGGRGREREKRFGGGGACVCSRFQSRISALEKYKIS